MADAADTMRYLVKSFDIAPAGTREEGQAAKGLSEVFHEHGLETANKSFRYRSLGRVPQAACVALMALVAILSGIAGGALPVVMLVVAVVVGALYGLELFGIKTVSRLGIAGSSQNVVARHPAAASAGANGGKARPVVVIAHYDTPRADLFSMPLLSRVQPYMRFIVMVGMAVDLVAILFQVIPFPVVVKSVAWAVAIVTSVVLLVWAASVILQRFAMPFTVGANDNKASIAALFGLLDRVRPLQGGPGFGPSDALYEAMSVEGEMSGLTGEQRRIDERDAHVRVSERRRSSREPEGSGVSRAASADEAPAASDGEPVGSSRRSRPRRSSAARPGDAPVRYGEKALRSLGILPESCVIEYERPAGPSHGDTGTVHRASDAQRNAAEGQPIGGATVMMDAVDPSAPAVAVASGTGGHAADEGSAVMPSADASQTVVAVDPEVIKDAAADAIMADIVGANTLSGSQAPQGQRAVPAAATALLTPVQADAAYVPPAPAPVQQQPFHVITSSDDYDAELNNTRTGIIPPDVAAQSAAAASTFFSDEDSPAASAVVNDPMWGTSTFRPVSVGRRILGDIPDPAAAAIDPFSASNIETVGGYNPEDFSELDFETGRHQAVTPTMLEYERRRALDGFSAEITETPKRARRGKKGQQGRISHQAARMKAEMQEESFNDWLGLDEGFDAKTSGRQIGTWDNFSDDDGFAGQPAPGRSPRWQGGAARARSSSRRRRDGDNGDAEVRRAAMTLGDRDLISHEIWFVLTGASEAGHAGIEDFLKTYRNDLRGAYFINLECVGAGRQSLVLEEGLGRHVKADRRLVNLFGAASLGINRPLALTRMNWRDTEATAVLRSGARAVTVAGVEHGAPAHACWTGDTPEKVDPAMIDDIVDVLVEVIKNA